MLGAVAPRCPPDGPWRWPSTVRDHVVSVEHPPVCPPALSAAQGVLSFPSHLSPGLAMRLGAGSPQLPKRRRCLLEAPGVGAPESSPRPPVPAPHPCLAPQAPRAPLGAPPCIRPCIRPGPAPPGRQEQHHPQAPAVAWGEPPGEVVSTPSATASWAPLAFTGARCRSPLPRRCPV